MAGVMAEPHAVDRALRLAVIFAMVVGFVVTGAPARACSCGGGASENLPYSDGAFVGELVQKEQVGFNTVEWTFDVQHVAKGEFGPIAIVRTPEQESACGLHLATGDRIGLLLHRVDEGMWEGNLCGQYEPTEVLSAVSEHHPPDPKVDPIGGGILPLPWWGLGLIGAAVVGLLWMFARRSRRSAA
jgi:hypothetical protein